MKQPGIHENMMTQASMHACVHGMCKVMLTCIALGVACNHMSLEQVERHLTRCPHKTGLRSIVLSLVKKC